jgi:hypothetical protein
MGIAIELPIADKACGIKPKLVELDGFQITVFIDIKRGIRGRRENDQKQ